MVADNLEQVRCCRQITCLFRESPAASSSQAPGIPHASVEAPQRPAWLHSSKNPFRNRSAQGEVHVSQPPAQMPMHPSRGKRTLLCTKRTPFRDGINPPEGHREEPEGSLVKRMRLEETGHPHGATACSITAAGQLPPLPFSSGLLRSGCLGSPESLLHGNSHSPMLCLSFFCPP